jgi:hypothetical protein
MYTHTHTLAQACKTTCIYVYMYVYVCVPVCACMRVRVCVRMCVHEYTGFLAAAFWHVWRGRIPQQDEGLVYAKIDVLWWRADVRRRATDARVREGGVEAGVDGYQGEGGTRWACFCAWAIALSLRLRSGQPR